MRRICHNQRGSHAICIKRCKDLVGQSVSPEVCFKAIPTCRAAEADAEEVNHG